MKLKHISINICLAAAAIFGGMVACTDDHYDVQSPQHGGNSNESLWEVITSNPELSDFAEVCAQALYYTDEVTPSKNGYTFADLLKGNSQLTVFAPINGSFDKQEMLEMARENGYDLQNMFLGNHIARFRYEVAGLEPRSMNMLNGKILPLDNVAKSLNGTAFLLTNTPAKNGVLHVLAEPTPFAMNVYEYLRSNVATNKMAKFFCGGDTAYFQAGASVEGDIDPVTGQMVYLDSMFYRSNLYFSSNYLAEFPIETYILPGTGAKLNVEDSSYVAIIPTNNAWDAALEKYRKMTRLAPRYADNTARNLATSHTDVAYSALTDTIPTGLDELLAMSYLQKSLFINLGHNMRKDPLLTLDNFDERKASYDFYVNAQNDTLRNLPYGKNRNLDIPVENDVIGSDYDPTHRWDKLSIFDGKTPLRLSNGLAYVVDNIAIDPRLVVKRDVRIEGEYPRYLYLPEVAQKNGGAAGLNKADDPKGLWERFGIQPERLTKKYGKLSGGFGYTGSSLASATYLCYGLKGNIFAGKYDIYVVTVPYAMVRDDSTEVGHGYSFEARLACVTESGPETLIGNLTAFTNEETGKTTFTTSGDKVDTILLKRDFEFPYSYVGVDDSWPTLQFKINTASFGDSKSKRARLAIDFIYLKAKED